MDAVVIGAENSHPSSAFSIDSIAVKAPSYPARAIEANPAMSGQNGDSAAAASRAGENHRVQGNSRLTPTSRLVWILLFDRAARGYSSSSI
jgi:hypothetical protein